MAKKFFVDAKGLAVLKKPRTRAILNSAVARDVIPIPYFESPADLVAVGGLGHTMIFDIECYPNYFLIGFMHLESGRYVELEITPEKHFDINLLNWLMWNFRLIGFNSNSYDVPMMLLALRGYGTERLKECSNLIVGNKSAGIEGMRLGDTLKYFKLRIPAIDHIDLIEVCPLSGSLKLYAARLFANRIQDLPYDHTQELNFDQAMHVKNYCLGSDIPATALILNELSEQVKLRYELSAIYNIDLRSKSDAQIAEAAFKSEIKRITGKEVSDHTIKPGEKFQYIVPDFISFQTPLMQRTLASIADAKFITDAAGAPVWPVGLGELEKGKDGKDRWVLKVKIADTLYTIGMGGLHSNEKCAAHKANENEEIHDDDAESYYPWIILNQRLFPKHIGEVFLQVYKIFVEKRINAKGLAKRFKQLLDKISELANKVIADSLKIVINGSFGKLGSFWSKIYAPDLMLQVTLSGQFCLLMLIEEFELNGIPVISANTDGIVTKPNKNKLALKEEIIKRWEKHTGFKTERTDYSALYSRDINNYIAVKTPDPKTGEVKLKLKGAYLNPWADKELAIFRFHKNPRTTICIEAVEALIIDRVPVEKTIKECQDIRKFTACQQVDGGAHKDGVFLGKVVRWYYATGIKGGINRVGTNNKVNETDGAKPLMDLPDSLPDDIDYDWYIKKANTILYDIGFYDRPKLKQLFD